ncbi:MAG: UDP-N-acetylmuramoyl-tripeptide--D-alanyl-D-alanine ligase [Pseudomonadota bacterium]
MADNGMNLSLAQIAQWLPQARAVGDAQVRVQRVHTDTRSLQNGDLFVALRGERFDAHDFLPQAQASGAVAALAEQGLAKANLSGLEVGDTRQALGQLAQAWRAQFDLPLIAVTGSNGKTTVTQMIASILRTAHGEHAHHTQGNLNNDIGVPQTLLRLRATHRASVVELGMNHPGEIAQLAAMAQPTVGLVNNAQREHQEFMGSVEAVAHENGAVLSALPAHGVAVFPADDAFAPLWQGLAGTRPCMRFSLDATSSADVRLRQAQWAQGAWQMQADTPMGELQTQLHIAGRHNVGNALAAAAAALAAGVSLADVAQGLRDFAPVAGRSRAFALHCAGREITVVDDTYNANPDSVRAAIDVLAELPAPHLLVLGDMGEVGTQGPAFHREVGEYAHSRGLAHVLCLGELAQHTAQACAGAQHFTDIDHLQAQAMRCLPQVGSVLVKGSRFMKMERVIQALSSCTPMGDASHPKETPACC